MNLNHYISRFCGDINAIFFLSMPVLKCHCLNNLILMIFLISFYGCNMTFKKEELNCKYGYVEYSDSITKYCGCVDSENNRVGKWNLFDKDGIRCETHNYQNGKRIGEQFEYLKNQEIKTYTYNNFDGITIFQRSYDSCGKVLSTTGHYIVMVNTSLSAVKSLQPGDYIEIDVYIALPKNCNVLLYGGFRSDKKLKLLKIAHTCAKFKRRLESCGDDELIVKLIVNDTDKGITVIEKYKLKMVKGKKPC
jgi:hypothetical protein